MSQYHLTLHFYRRLSSILVSDKPKKRDISTFKNKKAAGKCIKKVEEEKRNIEKKTLDPPIHQKVKRLSACLPRNSFLSSHLKLYVVTFLPGPTVI
jgi:hypothetical protein